MFMVCEGDIVVMHVENHSGEVHPLHVHGHHAVVLSRDGVAATGSPWVSDSLNVRDGQSFDIAIVAGNRESGITATTSSTPRPAWSPTLPTRASTHRSCSDPGATTPSGP